MIAHDSVSYLQSNMQLLIKGIIMKLYIKVFIIILSNSWTIQLHAPSDRQSFFPTSKVRFFKEITSKLLDKITTPHQPDKTTKKPHPTTQQQEPKISSPTTERVILSPTLAYYKWDVPSNPDCWDDTDQPIAQAQQ